MFMRAYGRLRLRNEVVEIRVNKLRVKHKTAKVFQLVDSYTSPVFKIVGFARRCSPDRRVVEEVNSYRAETVQ